MKNALAIVLAAGKSTRMKSALPKVVHEVCGRPMVDYVLEAARLAGVADIVAVIGYEAEHVRGVMSHHSDVTFALQTEQKGTGHAIQMCLPQLKEHAGPVLILAGDTPLLKASSLRSLLETQAEQKAGCVIGTAFTSQNKGLGRIVRGTDGKFERIVEEKDATDEQKKIEEINTGCYAFDGPALVSALGKLTPNNAQGEYYLTDCPALIQAMGHPVVATPSFTITEALGVNTRVQLAEVTQAIQRQTCERLMLSGVTIAVPEQTYIDPQATIGADTIIYPFTAIRGATTIGSECQIGPHAIIEGPVELLPGTKVGPFQVVRG